MGKKDAFCDAIDKFIVKQTIKENERYRKYKEEEGDKEGNLKYSFSPSFISSVDCLRAWYYHYLREPVDEGCIDPRLQRIFANGHSMHDRVQAMLQKMGILEKEDTEIKIIDDEWMISGRVDGVVKRKKNNKVSKLVLEIKSANANTFDRVGKNGPLEKHKKQANIYMWLLELEQAVIYYECKNTQEHLSCITKYNPKLVDKKIKDNILKVLEHVELEDVPDVCYNGAVRECVWCNWQERCKEEGGTKRKNILKV